MEKYKYEGKEEQSLIKNACEDLQLNINDIYYNVHEEKVGLLKSKRIFLEAVKVSDIFEYTKSLLKEILSGFGVNAQVESKIRDNLISFEIHSDNNSILIGKQGRILGSLQTYIRQAVFNMCDIFPNITIDIENYKEKQNYFLEKKVKKIAREVALNKTEVKLDPMNSYERKVVHSALTNFKYVETESVGEEPNRCVIIKYTSTKALDE